MSHPLHIPARVHRFKDLNELPIFFIVGRGRSGSTLLRSLFDAHPQVMIPLESRFVQFLYYKYPLEKKWTPETAKQIIQELGHSFEPPRLDKENLTKQITNHISDLSFGKICKLIYLNSHTEFPKEEIHAIGDKNPRYTFFIPQLLKIFPNAKFIHLIRDYRDNVTAIQRAGSNINESSNIYFAMGRWKLYNRIVDKYQKRFPDNFYTVRFEDLITDPEKEMKSLCNFLTLDFRPEMLNYHKHISKYFKDDGFNTLHKSLQTPFDQSKIGEWKNILSHREIIRCEILAGNLPIKYGYLPEFNVKIAKRVGTKLVYFPLYFIGQIRFLLKIPLYKSRCFMRLAYNFLLRIK